MWFWFFFIFFLLNYLLGSSKIIDTEGKNTPYIVARYYRAPELLLCISNYSFPIDIWGIQNHFSIK